MVQQGEALLEPIGHGDRYRAVELDHQRGVEAHEFVLR